MLREIHSFTVTGGKPKRKNYVAPFRRDCFVCRIVWPLVISHRHVTNDCFLITRSGAPLSLMGRELTDRSVTFRQPGSLLDEARTQQV
jgi:hypothetical protein